MLQLYCSIIDGFAPAVLYSPEDEGSEPSFTTVDTQTNSQVPGVICGEMRSAA